MTIHTYRLVGIDAEPIEVRVGQGGVTVVDRFGGTLQTINRAPADFRC